MTSLHSRYDPWGEAEKYLDSLHLGASIKYFILVEPGKGYLVPILQRRFPQAKIVILHAVSPPAEGYEGVPVWHPGCGTSAAQFLEKEIPDTEAGAVKLIEWRPALALYGRACLELLKGAANFIRRADANARTLRVFGRRWARNFFRNLGFPFDFIEGKAVSGPIVITGSGPGLEDALPLIRAMEPRPLILAASSSVSALYAGGLMPDLVISTDGGGWALTHLRECLRYPGGAKPGAGGNIRTPFLLALNLCAALPSQCAETPVIALNDGSLWQSIVFRGLGIPSLTVPSRGTVTASALDLALALGAGPVFLCGMDLAVRDIRTHARPYGFDFLTRDRATRLSPLYSLAFTRAGELKGGKSHDIYAAWFDDARRSWPGRIFSLGANHPVFDGLKIPGPDEKSRSPAGGFAAGGPAAAGFPFDGPPAENGHGSADQNGGAPSAPPSPGGVRPGTAVPDPRRNNPADRAALAAEILTRALRDPAFAAPLMKELVPLLFPGKNEAPRDEAAAALTAMVRRGK
ncbi:MAG: DUF115 domain-containing protein [Treponema sp.]|jgi:hypothetical protein|nr:DUF115 domain-containing protein [Treponema sp.]